MFIFKQSYIVLINELEYCYKLNKVYIINYQIDLHCMFDAIFRFDNILVHEPRAEI